MKYVNMIYRLYCMYSALVCTQQYPCMPFLDVNDGKLCIQQDPASTTSLCPYIQVCLSLYIQPQPPLPASASTPRLSLHIRLLFPHLNPVPTSIPVPAFTSGLILYIQPQPLLPASASTPRLSLYESTSSLGFATQSLPLHSISTSTSILDFYSTSSLSLQTSHTCPCPIVHDASKCFFYFNFSHSLWILYTKK